MKKYLDKLPQELKELIRQAAQVSAQVDMPAYLVGGFVRDLLIGVKNLDLDIVVEGDGIKYAESLAAFLNAELLRHKRFGTATLILKDSLKIDVATARSEVYPCPASLPQVSPGTLKQDLARRDFTINAMAISLMDNDFGKLVDYFKGKDDLKRKSVRVLHALSFVDDPTRILRAIRFEKRYNFKIEAKTLAHFKHAVGMGMLERVQPQRVRDELILLLSEPAPIKQIKRLRELAGLEFISPALKRRVTADGLFLAIEKNVSRMQKLYPGRRRIETWLVYFMGLLDPVSMDDARQVCAKFVLRNGDQKRILSYKKIGPDFIDELEQSKIKPARIFSLLEPLSYEVIILLMAKYRNRILQQNVGDFFEVYNGMRPFVRGHDLHHLGITPGPEYKKIFTAVLEAKLNGAVRTKDEELDLIKKLIRSK